MMHQPRRDAKPARRSASAAHCGLWSLLAALTSLPRGAAAARHHGHLNANGEERLIGWQVRPGMADIIARSLQ